MTQAFSSLRVNSDRMLDAFNQLAAIGATADSGVDRPTLLVALVAGYVMSVLLPIHQLPAWT